LKSNMSKKRLELLLVVALLAMTILAIASAPATRAQSDYTVQSEPSPLVDGTSRIGSTTGALADAQTQDFTYKDITEQDTGSSTYAYVTSESVNEGGVTGSGNAAADDGSYENIFENNLGVPTSYNPSSYSPLLKTRYVSGTTADLTSNDSAYMNFKGYPSAFAGDVQVAENEAEATYSTDTNYQNRINWTWTPAATDNYLIIGTAEIKRTSTTAARTTKANLLVDGTEVGETFVGDDTDVDTYRSFVAFKVSLLTGGSAHTVTLQYGTTNVNNTATIKNARVTAIKIGNNFRASEPANSTTTSSSYADIATLTFTPEITENWLILAQADTTNSAAANFNGVLLAVDGDNRGEYYTRRGNSTDYLPAAFQHLVSLSGSSSHTIKIQMMTTAGTMTYKNVHLYAIPTAAVFLENFFDNQDAESTTTSAYPGTTRTTLSFTPSSAGDYLILATGELRTSSTTIFVGASLTVGSTVYGTDNVQAANVNQWLPFAIQKRLTNLSGAQTATISFYVQTAGTTVAIRNARIIALRLPTASNYVENVEFTGTSNTDASWDNIVWTVDGNWSAASVSATLRLYNYSLGRYAESGEDGYTSYASSGTAGTDETKTQTITTSPTSFRDASGNWKINAYGTKASENRFNLKADWVEFKPSTPAYRENVQHNITGISSGDNYTLETEHYLAGDAESVSVYLYNFSTTSWVNVGSMTSTTLNTFSYDLTSTNYISGGEVRVRYVQADNDSTRTSLMIDYTRVKSSDLDYRLNWEHKVTGIGSHDNYRVRIYGYSDSGETFSVYVWDGSGWVDNGYNLPPGASAWVDYQIPSSWVIGGAVSIKYDDDTGGDTTAQSVHIDFSGVRGIDAGAFDFSLGASPSSVTMWQDSTATSTVDVSLVSGSPETVYLSRGWVGTAPSGVTASLGSSSGTPSYNSVLTFTATESASLGTFTYQMTADSGSLSKTKNITLTINEAAFGFSLSASPSTLTLVRGASATSTVSISLAFGTAQAIGLSGSWVGTAPTGISDAFGTSSGTPPFSSVLTLTASSGASSGEYTYRMKGTVGSTEQTTDIIVTLTPSAPSLLSPGDGTVLESLTPTFDWADAAGATSYTIRVATDNSFTYVVFSTSATESTVESPTTLSYGTRYYWRVQGTNAAGTGSWSSTWSFTAKASVPKVTSFSLAAGAQYTNSGNIQLTIGAQNAIDMSFSSDGVVWDNWVPYQTSGSCILSGPDGTKNIYIRVRDNAGDIGQTLAGTIVLDQTPPTTAKDLSGDMGADGYKNSVVITLSASDVTSGVGSTTYRVDGGEWKTGSSFPISSVGAHTVEYYSTDEAGNLESTKSFDVTVVSTATALPSYLWAVLAAIVVVIAVPGYFFRKHMHKKGLVTKLDGVRKEIGTIPKLKKDAANKYYTKASMSRDTYRELIKNYDARLEELKNQERELKSKVKKPKQPQ